MIFFRIQIFQEAKVNENNDFESGYYAEFQGICCWNNCVILSLYRLCYYRFNGDSQLTSLSSANLLRQANEKFEWPTIFRDLLPKDV